MALSYSGMNCTQLYNKTVVLFIDVYYDERHLYDIYKSKSMSI